MNDVLSVDSYIRPVTRYIISKGLVTESGGSVEECGEFSSEILAQNTALALVTAETILAQPPKEILRDAVPVWDRDAGWAERVRQAHSMASEVAGNQPSPRFTK